MRKSTWKKNAPVQVMMLSFGFAGSLLLLAACGPAEADVPSTAGERQATATPPDLLALPECVMIEQQKACQDGDSSCQLDLQPPPPPPGACKPPEGGAAVSTGQPLPPDPLGFLFDADDSGDLDAAERAALLADMAERCKNHKALVLARFDVNEDGTLSEQEQTTARQTVKQELAAQVGKLVSAHDTDGDGCLSPEEMKPVMEQKKKDLGQQFDADKDGALSSSELAALRAYLRQQFRAGLQPGQQT